MPAAEVWYTLRGVSRPAGRKKKRGGIRYGENNNDDNNTEARSADFIVGVRFFRTVKDKNKLREPKLLL